MLILPRYSQDLSLSNHLHRFDPLNYPPGRCCGARPLHPAQAAFDMAVIRFDPVIGVLPGTLSTRSGQVFFFLQLSDRGRITA